MGGICAQPVFLTIQGLLCASRSLCALIEERGREALHYLGEKMHLYRVPACSCTSTWRNMQHAHVAIQGHSVHSPHERRASPLSGMQDERMNSLSGGSHGQTQCKIRMCGIPYLAQLTALNTHAHIQAGQPSALTCVCARLPVRMRAND